MSQEPVSLETPIGEEEDSHLGDFIQDDNVLVPQDAAAFTLLHEQLMEVLLTLTEREQKVLRLRFGLDDGRPRTLEEVGKQFNVTRERNLTATRLVTTKIVFMETIKNLMVCKKAAFQYIICKALM